MQKTIILNGREINYELEYKKVKNINLRIRPDGTVHVSANRFHPKSRIDALLYSNADMICRALDKYAAAKESVSNVKVLSRATEGKRCDAILMPLCRKYYPYFAKYCGPFPEIKYRRMKSRWGSCRPKENILTFNTRLAYVPERCAEYVVVHEFSHFVHANHSAAFYNTVAAFMPDWKAQRTEIRKYETLLT